MQENKSNEANNKENRWNKVEEAIASEIIAGRDRVAHAKDFAIACLTIGIITVGIGMAILNYMNDSEWRELFASYDYVSQDGEGYNYYNSDIGGDVNNGTKNTEEEE